MSRIGEMFPIDHGALASCLGIAAIALFTSPVLGELSQQYVDWRSGPASWLMTGDEQSRWLQVSSDSEAEAFIRLFWARRDPVLATKQNEFKETFERRVAYADDSFSSRGFRGSLSDRGKVYILLGAPSERSRKDVRRRHSQVGIGSAWSERTTGYVGKLEAMAREIGVKPRAPSISEDFGGGGTISSKAVQENWFYDAGVMPGSLGSEESAFVFTNGVLEGNIILGVLERAVRECLLHPDLNLSIENAALAAAVDALKLNLSGPWDDLHLYYGEFVRPPGLVRTLPERFISLQAYHAGGAETLDLVTFFGELTDEDGLVARAWEELVLLQPLGDDVWCDISFEIPEGAYEGVYGLAIADRPIAMGRIDLEVKGTSTPDTGVSRLILSTDIHPLHPSQKKTAPFSFGGLKVVPKGDGTFRSKDNLWYFIEMRNPGRSPGDSGSETAEVDTSTDDTQPAGPAVQFSMGVTGTTTEGEAVKVSAPFAPAPLLQMKGMAGHYCLGGSIPLTSFKPGNYTLRISLHDSILNAWYHVGENFRIVD